MEIKKHTRESRSRKSRNSRKYKKTRIIFRRVKSRKLARTIGLQPYDKGTRAPRLPKVKRTYKDSVFCKLFNNEDKILELYNALSGKTYPKGTHIEIVTLKDAIFGGIKNDLAFIIDKTFIVLTEHQSTLSPNMPLRMFCYLAEEYKQLAYSNAIYSSHLAQIPAPEMYVFYNGKEDAPLKQRLKLSDAFLQKRDTIYAEAVVDVINVNYEKSGELLKKCRTMKEYSLFIYKIRCCLKKGMELRAAIEQSIRECMKEGILREFLKQNGGDIVNFLYETLSREECEAIREEDGYLRGLEKGEELGRKKQQIKIACKMKEHKVPLEKIAELTELTLEQIRAL